MQLKKIFISVIAFSTVSAVGIVPVNADPVSEKNAQIQIKKIESNSLLRQINQAQNQVAKLNNQVSDKVVAINDAKIKIDDTNQEISVLGKKIDHKKVEISKRKDNLKDQVRSLQAASNNSVTGNTFLDFVLGSTSLSDLIGRSVAVNRLNSASQSALKSVEKATSELADLKSTKASKKSELVATKSQLEKDRDQLVGLKQQAQKSADKLAEQLSAHKDELNKLESELTVAMAESAVKAARAQQDTKATAASDASTVALSNNSSNQGQSSQAQTVDSAANNSPSAAIDSGANLVATSNNSATSSVNSGISVQSGGNQSAASAPVHTATSGGVVGIAAQYLGVPYVWGGTTPAGFDCSGFVQYVYAQAGISLPRTTYAQAALGTPISVSEAQPGDLLFWGSGNNCYHVAIAVGGGRYIHAPAPGQSVSYGSVAGFAPSTARRL